MILLISNIKKVGVVLRQCSLCATEDAVDKPYIEKGVEADSMPRNEINYSIIE